VNNIFYNVSHDGGGYPARNFTTRVLREFMDRVQKDWLVKYGDEVLGFETLVELPRTGELYRRAGFEVVGQTKGFTCKRVAGAGSDSWGGARIWDTKNLRPKSVLCRRAPGLIL
tara:strand:- start:85 stop:426 length:342 start_codon:yes stop_codon:yes gene_type:complete